MNLYTLRDFSVMGEKDETYGYTYWVKVSDESDLPLRFSSHIVLNQENVPIIVAAESSEARTGIKGDYLQLKKVKIAEEPTQTADSGALKATLKEETNLPSTPAAEPKAPEYEGGTNARWAIKMSFDSYIRTIGYPPEEDDTNRMWEAIEANAKKLVDIFHRIKGG